jgi:hypothetical protein
MHSIADIGVLSAKVRALASAAALACCTTLFVPTSALSAPPNEMVPFQAWRSGFLAHVERMRQFVDHDRRPQAKPATSSDIIYDSNDSGILATYRPDGPVLTPGNAFFQPLGSNGRSCFTCHQPHESWSVSAAGARARFAASDGADPLFRLVDGATCPTAKVDTPAQRRRAYRLLTEKGLFRIGLPLPAAPALQFKVNAMRDPYHCTSDRTTGLTSPTAGVMSVYRRPLPSTNLGFITSVMWDGREPDLATQVVDATLGHAQASAAPSDELRDQIVAFESGIFTAQSRDNQAGELRGLGAKGGPVMLARQLPKFFLGVNDPTGQNPKGLPFNSKIFNLYKVWRTLPRTDEADQHRLSVARGERIFNTVQFNLTDVGGINDPVTRPVVVASCGTCHDAPNVGSHSIPALLNIGVSNAGAFRSPRLDISGLPIFMLECTGGPLAGKVFETTDPGRALITGDCADIGKFKIPALRGLAARAPYFHNGSAETLDDVVTFYDRRFSIGLTRRQREDLVNFLKTL